MSAKTYFSNKISARFEAIELTQSIDKDLHNFVKPRLDALHRVGRAVLLKSSGNRLHSIAFNEQFVESNFEWLSAQYIKITEIDSYRVVFDLKDGWGQKTGVGQIAISELFQSDRDFAKKMRTSIVNIKKKREYTIAQKAEQITWDLRNNIAKAEKELEKAKKALAKNEKENSNK